MNTMLRRRAMIAAGGGTPPTPPTPSYVPYIRNTIGAYIDTGITADNTTRVIVWARNFNPGSVALFGSRVGGTDRTLILVAPPAQNTGRLRYDFGSSQFFSQDAFALLSGYHKYEVNGTQFLVDDNEVATATSATFSNNLNIHLFGCNTNGTHTDMGLPADICAAKIYKNDVLVRDYTPVESPSVGFYDAVSDTVFTNVGSGSLSYGVFDANAYTPLEYIECSSEQYFDTDATISYSDSIVVKFKPTGTTKRFYFLLSAPEYNDGTYITRFRAYLGNSSDLYRRFYLEYGKVASGSSLSATQLYNSTNPNLKDRDIVFSKDANKARLYSNNALIGTEATFTEAPSGMETGNTCLVGNSDTEGTTETYNGRLYHIGIGSKRSLSPAKVNNVAGMYDNYNDVFYPSESGTPFVAGPALNS